jgi:hypothetical protein
VDGLLVEWRTRELEAADALAAKLRAKETARRPLLERRASDEAAMKAECQSIHTIARVIGVDRATVRNDLAVQFGNWLKGAG